MRIFFLKSILFLAAFIAVERFCHKQTHGFRLQKIQSDLPHDPAWETTPLSVEEMQNIKKLLSQPYYFLGSGGQCYAFVSQDHQTVLKMFKHHHMRPQSWLDTLPVPKIFESFRQKHQKIRMERLNTIFSSCKIAYDRFREGTGLIYMHLNKTNDLKQKLKLFDAIGSVHEIDLDQTEFALQKKATMTYPTIASLMEAQEIEAAKARLISFLDLILERCKVGVVDHDPRKRNFGFVGEKAIEIDLGSFSVNEYLKSPKAGKRILFFETMKLRRWINKNYPQLSEFFTHHLDQILTEENSNIEEEKKVL